MLIAMIILYEVYYVQGQLSQNYKIPSYYGSRAKDFLLRGSILTGSLSSFNWNPKISQFDDKYYYSDSINQVIWEIDESKSKRTIIAGLMGQNGYRDGDFRNTLFNYPSGIVYYKQNVLKRQQEKSKQTIILKNNLTGSFQNYFYILSYKECIFSDQFNYTNCQETSLEDKQNVFLPPINKQLIQVNKDYKIYDLIDINRIKDIYFFDEESQDLMRSEYLDPVIYIADKENHCIRKLDLNKQITSTVGGICGQLGFKDGQTGVNLMNQPDNIGVDELGNIFVNDSGNRYIRMINPSGYVVTLLQGACREDTRYPLLYYQSLKIRRVLCYRNWAKISGEPSQHILTSEDDMNICTKILSEC